MVSGECKVEALPSSGAAISLKGEEKDLQHRYKK